MVLLLFVLTMSLHLVGGAAPASSSMPVLQPRLWTTHPVRAAATVRHNRTHIVMENSLVSRIWRIDLDSGLLQASVLRVDAGCYDCDGEGENCDNHLKAIPCAANLYGKDEDNAFGFARQFLCMAHNICRVRVVMFTQFALCGQRKTSTDTLSSTTSS